MGTTSTRHWGMSLSAWTQALNGVARSYLLPWKADGRQDPPAPVARPDDPAASLSARSEAEHAQAGLLQATLAGLERIARTNTELLHRDTLKFCAMADLIRELGLLARMQSARGDQLGEVITRDDLLAQLARVFTLGGNSPRTRAVLGHRVGAGQEQPASVGPRPQNPRKTQGGGVRARTHDLPDGGHGRWPAWRPCAVGATFCVQRSGHRYADRSLGGDGQRSISDLMLTILGLFLKTRENTEVFWLVFKA